MGLTFFGLTLDTAPQVRLNLFTQIHEIVFYGKGGYDWDTVYNMPVWLRKFTLSKIEEHYIKESESVQGKENSVVDAKGNVNKEMFKLASQAYKSTPKSKNK